MSSDFMKQFLEDAEGQMASLNHSLLAVEKDPSDIAAMNELFRAVHNLKGGSATMDLDDISTLTHEMENVLDKLRNGDIFLENAIADTLFHCADALDGLLKCAAAGRASNADTRELRETLRGFIAASPAEAAAQKIETKTPTAESGVSASLTAEERGSLEENLRSGATAYELTLLFQKDAMMPDVRLQIILRDLRGIGEIIQCSPDPDSLNEEENQLEFRILLTTFAIEGEVREAVDETDIESVRVVAIEKDAVVREEKPAAAVARPESAPATAEKTDIPSPAPGAGRSTTIRVDAGRLDDLMSVVGELVINRTRFAQVKNDLKNIGLEEDGAADSGQILKRLRLLDGEFDACHQQMGRIANDLQARALRMRMMPIRNVFTRFERVTRDLCRQTGKQVRLEMFGQDTELDKTVIELIGDPLMHIVRNAVGHGIGTPEERLAAGLSPEGRLTLRAFHESNHVLIEIEDDGRGIDAEKTRNAAVRKGLISEREAETMSDREAIQLIFMAGFSTAKSVDEISGRGVGMDVVVKNIERMNGMVDVRTAPGRGTCFSIRIPLTLAIIQALLVEVSGDIFAIPLINVLEVLRFGDEDLNAIDGHPVAMVRGSALSLLHLDDVLGLPPRRTKSRHIYVVVVGIGSKRAGLVVHRHRERQDIVIKSMGVEFKDIPAIAGASILGDGRVSLILDTHALVEMGLKRKDAAHSSARAAR